MTSIDRVYAARLARMLVLGPLGESLGRVRDVVVSISIVRRQPRVLGLVVHRPAGTLRDLGGLELGDDGRAAQDGVRAQGRAVVHGPVRFGAVGRVANALAPRLRVVGRRSGRGSPVLWKGCDRHGVAHYLDIGTGPAAVFVHGIATNAYLWRNVIGALTTRGQRRCIALDLPLHGQSPVTAGQDLALAARVVRLVFARETRLHAKHRLLVVDPDEERHGLTLAYSPYRVVPLEKTPGGSQKRRLIETTDAGRTWRVVHRWR